MDVLLDLIMLRLCCARHWKAMSVLNGPFVSMASGAMTPVCGMWYSSCILPQVDVDVI